MSLRPVALPLLEDELDRLPLRWSDPSIHFPTTELAWATTRSRKKKAEPKTSVPRSLGVSYTRDGTTYMRLYMRARRGQA